MADSKQSESSQEFVELQQSLDERLNILSASIVSTSEEMQKSTVTNFNHDCHWQKLGLSCQAVSKECTKLAVAFSKEPEPSIEDTKRLLQDVDRSIDVLQAWAIAYPLTEGKMVYDGLIRLVISIVNEVKDFINSVEQDRCTSNSRRLVSTGTIWEECDKVKLLPKDNCTAFQRENESILAMVTDALEELETAISEDSFATDSDNDEEGSWRQQDKKILKSSLGLLKTCKNCLKKVLQSVGQKGDCRNVENIKELDVIVLILADISPCVDDFALSLYPPIVVSKVKQEAKTLQKKASDFVELVRNSHFVTTNDHKWISIITTAIHHNYSKIEEAIAELEGDSSNL